MNANKYEFLYCIYNMKYKKCGLLKIPGKQLIYFYTTFFKINIDSFTHALAQIQY